MSFRLFALVLIPSIFAAQTPTTPPAQTKSVDQISVPQGSLVALKLISTIKSKSTRSGDPVRAIVAFPLAIDARTAIPAGTYVEGTVDKVNAHPFGGAPATVQLRFTRLLFANGYSVPLAATNTQALLPAPIDSRRTNVALADARDGSPYLGEGFAASGQNPTQPPPLPPLPSVGPSPGELAGIGIGAGVGILVLTLAIGHHRATSTDYVLFDSGWQFQIALQEPLTLDSDQVSAAMAR
ncbi:MAG TPA: hypothetical protein VGI45_28230 [Terracidiphilus sp.]|jgi:hypothetical protein